MEILTGILALLSMSVYAAGDLATPTAPHYDYALVSLVPSVYLNEPAVHENEQVPKWTSCITYLRSKWMIPIFGDALFQSPNTTLAEVQYGDVVVFLYGRGVDKSHVAMFDRLDKTGFWVWEYNRKPGLEEHRLVSYSDPYLLGFKSFK